MGGVRRKTATWKQYFQARLATRPASRYSCTGKSTMMIFPSKASSGLTLVSVENNFLSGRVISGLTSIENDRSEEHTSELQSLRHLVCRLLLEKNALRAWIEHDGDYDDGRASREFRVFLR